MLEINDIVAGDLLTCRHELYADPPNALGYHLIMDPTFFRTLPFDDEIIIPGGTPMLVLGKYGSIAQLLKLVFNGRIFLADDISLTYLSKVETK